jgi:uncharacterized protein (TIGR02996 family)
MSGPRPELLGFLDEIKASPGEDTPRLILADWLEEQPDPADAARGQLMRVQCELARVGVGDPRGSALQRRQDALLAQHARAWLGPLGGLLASRYFWGGLLRVTLDARGFVEAAGSGVAGTEAWAWVETLQLCHGADLPPERLREGLGLFEPVAELNLRSAGAGDRQVELLAGSPHVSRVVAFNLGNNRLTDRALLALARSPHLKRLRHLYLNGNQIGSPGVAELARSPLLGRLATLELAGNQVRDDGVLALTRSPHLPADVLVSLFNNPASAEAERALRARLGW